MKVDDPLALKALIESGTGIGMMPAYMESPGLVRLFDGLYDPKRDSQECHLYYVYPSYIKNYRRVTALKSHLVNKLQGSPHFHSIVSV